MSTNVVIIVDLDITAAPPAGDSVRQLLALIDGLDTDGGELDWRLVSVSLNSPLRAELRAFTKEGDEVSDARLIGAVHKGLEVLDGINDNGLTVQRLTEMAQAERLRLKTLLYPLKGRSGRVQISVSDRLEYSLTSHVAEQVLDDIKLSERKPNPPVPEPGSLEGSISEVTTHDGRPAVKLRRDFTDELVICVFEEGAVESIGVNHTLAEVWEGRHVEVSGRLLFGPDAKLTQVRAETMRTLVSDKNTLELLRKAKISGELAVPLVPWGDNA